MSGCPVEAELKLVLAYVEQDSYAKSNGLRIGHGCHLRVSLSRLAENPSPAASLSPGQDRRLTEPLRLALPAGGHSWLFHRNTVLGQGSANSQGQITPNLGPILRLVGPDPQLEVHGVAGKTAEQSQGRRVLHNPGLHDCRAFKQFYDAVRFSRGSHRDGQVNSAQTVREGPVSYRLRDQAAVGHDDL